MTIYMLALSLIPTIFGLIVTISDKVLKVLKNYQEENSGVKLNLAKIMMHGKLAGSGKLMILPVDQGFEHGPSKSFVKNPSSFDPSYHLELAEKCGFSAYAAPMGALEAGFSARLSLVPTILKLNSSVSLCKAQDQAFTASVFDALRLGCSAVGITIYPGSEKFFEMLEEARETIREAKSFGLAVFVWSYPRGPEIPKDSETALDVVAYAAYIAAAIGANVIKVKPPSAKIHFDSIPSEYISTLSRRIAYIKRACFESRRLVVFSGGSVKDDNELFSEIKCIAEGGGDGSIVGRNSFQRSLRHAADVTDTISDILLRSTHS